MHSSRLCYAHESATVFSSAHRRELPRAQSERGSYLQLSPSMKTTQERGADDRGAALNASSAAAYPFEQSVTKGVHIGVTRAHAVAPPTSGPQSGGGETEGHGLLPAMAPLQFPGAEECCPSRSDANPMSADDCGRGREKRTLSGE